MAGVALTLAVQGRARFDDLPSRAIIARWIRTALVHDAELVVRFVGAVDARRLNRTYRAADYVPNVLTFSYEIKPTVRADIVLCVPVVRREARAQHKRFRDHLAHLIVHGVLHAQGHDHQHAKSALAMEAQEVAVLRQLGFDDPYRSTR